MCVLSEGRIRTDRHLDPGSQLLLWQGTPSPPLPALRAKSGRSLPARTSHQSVSEPATWLWSVPGWTGLASGTCPWNPRLSSHYHPVCQCLKDTESDRRKKEKGKAKWVKNKTDRKKTEQRKRPWQRERQERETDENKIRYSHPLMLFREWWEKECCVYFSSLITYRASGMCEMNLWLKRLNRHIQLYWDGLATMIVSQGLGMLARMCLCLLFSSNVSYFIYNRAFMWIHFTTIHLTFMLINPPSSK